MVCQKCSKFDKTKIAMRVIQASEAIYLYTEQDKIYSCPCCYHEEEIKMIDEDYIMGLEEEVLPSIFFTVA